MPCALVIAPALPLARVCSPCLLPPTAHYHSTSAVTLCLCTNSQDRCTRKRLNSLFAHAAWTAAWRWWQQRQVQAAPTSLESPVVGHA